MAAGPVPNIEFGDWLYVKLKELEIDETVFGSYIWGILDSDDSLEEKTEGLKEILAEITGTGNVEKICDEILGKWKSSESKEPSSNIASSNDMNDKLAKLLESQSLATTKQREHTEEEKKLRQAILSQYSQISDSEGEEDESGSAEPKNTLEKNTNTQLVADAEKIKREQSRLESQKKKEKDRQDREKQKNLKEEKKEKRKTQKGERKR